MSIVTITTQPELDSALADPKCTEIGIRSECGVWIELRDNTDKYVRASGKATVRASGKATVRASGKATVRASGKATVRASGKATVRAGSHTAVHLHSGTAHVEGGVLIDHTAVDLTDVTQWCAYHAVTVEDGCAVLYKAVRDDLRSAHGALYAIGQTTACDDWEPTNECGSGLHVSPSPTEAMRWVWNCESEGTVDAGHS